MFRHVDSLYDDFAYWQRRDATLSTAYSFAERGTDHPQRRRGRNRRRNRQNRVKASLAELEDLCSRALTYLEHFHNYTILLEEIRPATTHTKLATNPPPPNESAIAADEAFIQKIEQSEQVPRIVKQDLLTCYENMVDMRNERRLRNGDFPQIQIRTETNNALESASAAGSCETIAKWQASRTCLFAIIDRFSVSLDSNPPTTDTSETTTTANTSRSTSPNSVATTTATTNDFINVTAFYANKLPANPLSPNDEYVDPGEVSEDRKEIVVGDRSIALNGKGPMAVLNEVFPNLIYEMLLERAKSALETFTCRIRLNGNVFDGHGRSKKLARSNAAHAVIESLYGLKFAFQQKRHVNDPHYQQRAFESSQMTNQQFADAISLMVKSTFETISADDPALQRRKVLAGIVMTNSQMDLESGARVICVTTGTKCVNAENLCGRGRILRDCHAEIIARRCLIRFLMERMLEFIRDENDQSIFERVLDSDRFRLKDQYSFHLYISTSPCGDARVFSIHEGECNDGNDIHPNRKARGQLRKKIEAGEGTVLINPGTHVQTCDGIISGEPLQIMSCSDKICRWNIIGVQGSLLSVFCEPVYLSTIVIGTLFHSDHLKRAMYGRIEMFTSQDLPGSYRFHRPLLTKASLNLPRMARKAPFHSFVWYNNDGSSKFQEMINSETGTTDEQTSSKLCRKNLFDLWKLICTQCGSGGLDHYTQMVYADAKLLAADYRQTKSMAIRAFLLAGLGLWIKRPLEQDLFN